MTGFRRRLLGCSVEHGRVPYKPFWIYDRETNCKYKNAKPRKIHQPAWIYRIAWRPFLSKASPVMAIPISAPVNWYAYLTPTHPAFSWLKSEILGFRWRKLGRPMGNRSVPPGSVQPEECCRELSAVIELAIPWQETSFTRMRWPRSLSPSWFAMVILTSAPPIWWATSYLMPISWIDIDIVYRAGLRRWKLGCTVAHRRLPPEPFLTWSLECRAQ